MREIFREVLIVDAEHPDERPANQAPDALCQLVRRNPDPRIHAMIGNPEAMKDGTRFRDENIMTAEADPKGNSEQFRRFMNDAYIAGHELALARHGTRQPNSDYIACHPRADRFVWHAIALSGIQRVVHLPTVPRHITNLHTNYMVCDLGPDSPLTAERLHDLIKQVADDLGSRSLRTYKGKRYAFAAEITAEQAEQWGLPVEMKPFDDTFKPAIAARLGFPGVRTMTPLSASFNAYARHTGVYSECAIPWSTKAVKMLSIGK